MPARIAHPLHFLLENDLIHTQQDPFCVDPTCPYHEDRSFIEELNDRVEAGLMTTTPSLPPLQGEEQTLSSTLASLSSLSILWVPLEETIGQWADFAHEAFTVSALLAVGSAFGGLAWESKALRHYTWAVSERERGRPRKEAHWLERTVQDLDCALDQWQQAVSWLELAGNDDQQQEQTSLNTIHALIEQTHLHQERRRALHRQVLAEYASAKQQGRHPHQQSMEKGRWNHVDL